jgi:hypothetical protein
VVYVVAIVSANRTEACGFESRKGVHKVFRALCKHAL